MPEASLWLRAYVGVYAGTLTRRKQLILFIFRGHGTTCQVHMRYVVAYVVPDVMGQLCTCAIFSHRSAIEFRCHAIAKIYPVGRCRVRTPIATTLLHRKHTTRWAAASPLPVPTSD